MTDEERERVIKKVKDHLVDKFGDLVKPQILMEGLDEFSRFAPAVLKDINWPLAETEQPYFVTLTYVAGYIQGRKHDGKVCTESKRKRELDPDKYQTVNWTMLESLCMGGCECCDEKFSKDNPPDMCGKCHKGAVFVHYWGDFLFLACGTCHKPICKIPVNKSLI